MKTKAIVFRQANVPTLEEIAIPAVGAGDVRVRIAYSGVSIGTESSIFSGERTHNGTFPLVGGYMASGTVEEAGADVSACGVGDRVILSGPRFDCEVNSVWGGHSSMQVVRAGSCTKVPDGVDMRFAAMFVMPGVGLNAINMAGVKMTDTVLIQGQGLIGQLCGQWCRNRGARVITIEPDATRRELSRQYVTEQVIDPVNEDVAARLNELTAGAGPTVVVEATASAQLIGSATQYLRRENKMVFLSWYPDDITLTFAHFHNYQITAFFPTGNGGPPATRAALEAFRNGSIRMEDNITDVVGHEDACAGYRRIIDGDRSIMGMVVDWSGA